MTNLPEVGYTCSKCDLPVARINGIWQHAQAADAVACAIFSGNLAGWGATEDEEPEPGRHSDGV